MTAPFLVRFLPEGRDWQGTSPTPLTVAAAECGVLLEQPCGGKAVCGKCQVRLAGGVLPADDADLRVLGDEAVAGGWRLACRATAAANVVLEVPAGSRAVARKSFGDELLFAGGIDPLYPDGGWGLAVDLGTTTLAAALVDLGTGRAVAAAAALNPQAQYGSDVISRIAFAREYEPGAAELERLMRGALGALAAECAGAAGLAPGELRALAAAGNPTMTHTLLGLAPHGLGEAPFQGARYQSWARRGDALGLGLGTAAETYVLPGIGGHVGGDAVAAVLAAGLDLAERPALLVDLGTNTEVVLGSRHGIACTSASAGPAFEGGVIRYGMRAVPGAIDRVWLADGDLRTGTIGGEAAVGVCGSGLIDAVAALLAAGLIEPSGRVRPAEELEHAPAALRARLRDTADGRSVLLGGSARRPVLLTAGDVRELQLVKASIAAAASLLMERTGTGPEEVEAVLVAGAFGATIREASARTIGLLPLGEHCPVRFLGNAAGAGARLALVDREARRRAEHIAATARAVELAGDPAYEAIFVAALAFPAEGVVA